MNYQEFKSSVKRGFRFSPVAAGGPMIDKLNKLKGSILLGKVFCVMEVSSEGDQMLMAQEVDGDETRFIGDSVKVMPIPTENIFQAGEGNRFRAINPKDPADYVDFEALPPTPEERLKDGTKGMSKEEIDADQKGADEAVAKAFKRASDPLDELKDALLAKLAEKLVEKFLEDIGDKHVPTSVDLSARGSDKPTVH